MSLRHRWRAFRTVIWWEGWYGWVFAASVVLPIGAFAVFGATASNVMRYSGTFWQLLGIATVAVGLSKTRALFGVPSVTSRIAAWWQRLIRALRPPPIRGDLHITLGPVTFSAQGTVTAAVGAVVATLEDRVRELERDVASLRRETRQSAEQLRTDVGDLRREMTQEGDARRSAEADLRQLLQEVSTGGLHIETMGLWWLCLGVVTASIPNEIASGVFAVARVVGMLTRGINL